MQIRLSSVRLGRPLSHFGLTRPDSRIQATAFHQYSEYGKIASSDGSAIVAWFYLFACWSTRAFGSAALLCALGLSFSPTTALAMICLAAAAGVIPITSGGAVVNAGAAAGILLALGVGKDIAINFSLASGLLLVISALAATITGVLASLALRSSARHDLAGGSLALAPVKTRLR